MKGEKTFAPMYPVEEDNCGQSPENRGLIIQSWEKPIEDRPPNILTDITLTFVLYNKGPVGESLIIELSRIEPVEMERNQRNNKP